MANLNNFESLDRFILDKISETKLPGLSLATIDDGKVVYSRGFGFRDIEKGKPASPDTLYCIGSVTKSFTCVSIMQLQEKGLLSIEDNVEKYLQFKLRSKGEPVKIWHLMSHTSGIPALAYAEAVIRHTMKSADVWLPLVNGIDMYAFMDEAENWAHNKPGERWFYLNEGYRLLGLIVEKVSGERYEDYVKRHILDPIGMSRSFFKEEDVANDPEAAVPYIVTRDGGRIPSTYPYGIVSSDGGLISNVSDMIKYISMFLNHGKTIDGKNILSSESIDEMVKPRVKTPDQPFISTHERFYGFGLGSVKEDDGVITISHGGSVSTATAQLAFIPEKNIGVMILANGTGYPLSYLSDYVLKLMLSSDPRKLPVIQFESVLSDLEGVYETYKNTMKGKVTRKGSILVLETGDKYRDVSLPLIPVNWSSEPKIFNGISMDRLQTVEFYLEDNERYLIYERYKMKKVGKL